MALIRSLLLSCALGLALIAPAFAQTSPTTTHTFASSGSWTVNGLGQQSTCALIVSNTFTGAITVHGNDLYGDSNTLATYLYLTDASAAITGDGAYYVKCAGFASLTITATLSAGSATVVFGGSTGIVASGGGGSGTSGSVQLVSTAQSANATNTTATATFATAPALGNLVVACLSSNQYTITGGAPLRFSQGTGNGNDWAEVFLGYGDGTTTTFAFSGSSNGTNAIVLNLKATTGTFSVLTQNVPCGCVTTPMQFGAIAAPAGALVMYTMDFDNPQPTPITNLTAGWSSIFVGGQHGVWIVYQVTTTAGIVAPSADIANSGQGYMVTVIS